MSELRGKQVEKPHNNALLRVQSILAVRYRRARMAVRTMKVFAYDAGRFIRHAPVGRTPSNAKQYDAIITHDYHALEKGMALPEPEPGHGARYVSSLVEALRTSVAKYGWRRPARIGITVLEAHQAIQSDDTKNGEIADFLPSTIAERASEGGFKEVTRDEVLRVSRTDLTAFFSSRSSVRAFSDTPVALDLIRSSVRQAMKTPSVCNRQAWRAHLICSKDDIPKVLRFQNGNKGFGHRIDKLLVVTADLSQFLTGNERVQPWIDGGMFSMSLVYALHSQGLGTCCLNMSTSPQADRALRRVLNINAEESVVMMIAVGHLQERYRVTASPRRDLNEVLILHPPTEESM